MIGQIGAQLVGGRPSNPLPDPGGAESQRLLSHGKRHEEQGEAHQRRGFGPRHGTVDDPRHQLRVDQLQGDAASHQQAKNGYTGPVGAEVVA